MSVDAISPSAPLMSLSSTDPQSEMSTLSQSIQRLGTAIFESLRDIFYNVFVRPVGALYKLNSVMISMYSNEEFCHFVRSQLDPLKVIGHNEATLSNFPIATSLNNRFIASNSEHEEDFLAACWLLQTIHETISDVETRECMTAEVLAKIIAYRDLKEGRLIPIPTVDGNGKPCRVMYRIDRCFDLWKDIPVFGLIPVDKNDAPPLLLFRGTSLSLASKGGPASLSTSFDPSGSGWIPFEQHKQQLEEWLAAGTHTTKARLYGNGLGGSLATYAGLTLPQFIHKTAPSFIFNPLGVKEELCQRWAQLPEASHPRLQIYVTRGDIIPKFGFLFGEVIEVDPGERLYPLAAHKALVFLSRSCKLYKVDVEKENLSESRKLCHSWQKLHLPIVHNGIRIVLLGILYPISHLTSNTHNEGWLKGALTTMSVVKGIVGFI